MKTIKPHNKLPPNRLTEGQHQNAGLLAQSLMSKPAKAQKPVKQSDLKHAKIA